MLNTYFYWVNRFLGLALVLSNSVWVIGMWRILKYFFLLKSPLNQFSYHFFLTFSVMHWVKGLIKLFLSGTPTSDGLKLFLLKIFNLKKKTINWMKKIFFNKIIRMTSRCALTVLILIILTYTYKSLLFLLCKYYVQNLIRWILTTAIFVITYNFKPWSAFKLKLTLSRTFDVEPLTLVAVEVYFEMYF